MKKICSNGRGQREADVMVIGGGTAGVFAAICAAKSGAKTVLIEKNGVLGGTAVAAHVNFPGLFFAWGEQIIAGPCWESIERTVAYGGAKLPKIAFQPERHWHEQILVDRFIYACVLDEMCAQSGTEVRLHTVLSSLEERPEGVHVWLVDQEGSLEYRVKIVIDASGDAVAVRMLGYDYFVSDSLQPATLIHDLGGYDSACLTQEAVESFVHKAMADGRLSAEDFQGRRAYDQLIARRISMHVSAEGAQTAEGRSELERRARAKLMKIISVFRTFPGLEQLQVISFADTCGVRETVRIAGEIEMTAEAYLQGTRYSDAVCYCFYPIDLHQPTGIKQRFLEPGIIPTIPYGALVPKGASRILAAGRCIAGDTDCNSATRVQAPCMATGQAAGVAAALAAKQGVSVRQVDYEALCQGLQAIGAIVPKA